MSRKWINYFMGFAYHASIMSKDATKVGAVLVGPSREVRLTGYNGPPIGVEDRRERRERPAKYLFASHAEANIIAFAGRTGVRTEGCDLYVTHHPCATCARSIIQAGIKRVIYASSGFAPGSAMTDELEASATMFREAGVELICADSTIGTKIAEIVEFP